MHGAVFGGLSRIDYDFKYVKKLAGVSAAVTEQGLGFIYGDLALRQNFVRA